MSVSLHQSSTIRQPVVRPIPLGELLGMYRDGYAECQLRDELGLPHLGLDAHLDDLSAQIAAHPESAWTRMECLEERRLAR